jgi:hypothetical protein
MELFQSYKEAHEALKLQGSFQRGTLGNNKDGITSLKLTENPKSLDRISIDFEQIYYVGKGKKSSQGEPAENQVQKDQEPFFVSLRTQTPFPVLVKLKAGVVLYAGMYTVHTIHRRKSPKGFSYFLMELHRCANSS